MKRLLVVLLAGVMVLTLGACGKVGEAFSVLQELNEMEEMQEDYDDYEDYDEYDNYEDYDTSVESGESGYTENGEMIVSYDKWWNEPFHMTATWDATEEKVTELEILYDGTDLLVNKNGEPEYYITMKNGVARAYWITPKTKGSTVFDTKALSVLAYMENGMAYTPTIFSYTHSVHEYADMWKKVGSESVGGFDCDVYEQVNYWMTKDTLWLDKNTEALVQRKTELIVENGESETVFDSHYIMHTLETSNVPKVTERFDLEEYGGDPDVAAELLAQRCPQPDNGTIKEEIKSRYTYMAKMEWTKEEALAYVEQAKKAGYTESPFEYDYGNYYSYTASDSEGYKISIGWTEDQKGQEVVLYSNGY